MSEVVVLKCKEYDSNVDIVIEKALAKIKAEKIFKKGKKVLIKPNLLSASDPSKAITTHPRIVDAVCKYLKTFDVQVYIGESCGAIGIGKTENAFKKCGILDIAKKHNIKLINFDKDKKIITKNKNAVTMKNIVRSQNLTDIDIIIDVCKLKTHMLTGYTGAVKNMFGILPGKTKVSAHKIGKDITTFSNILLDIYSTFKPSLCIMDAIVGMEGNGPGAGTPKKTGLILASKDGIALDIVASNIIGYEFNELEFLKIAKRRKLISKKIKVLGLENAKIIYKKPLSYPKKSFIEFLNSFLDYTQNYISFNKRKCKKCGQCIESCPQKIIKKDKENYPLFYKEGCILCYCCHELCPHKAVIIKQPLIIYFMRKGRDIIVSLIQRL